MHGLIQDVALSLDLLLWRAQRLFPHKELVTAVGDGVRRTTYRDFVEQADLVGGILDHLGVTDEGRVGSLCWATDTHMALFFGVPCSGRILHTLNPRFSDGQLVYSVNKAADEAVFVDGSLAPRIWHLLAEFETVRHVVLVDGDGVELPPPPDGVRIHSFDELVAVAQPGRREVTDERQAALLCFTSGTTGDPKGVLYSHRSLVLHAMNLASADGLGIRETDVVLMGGQMFHANGMGLPQVCVSVGSTLVLPGSNVSGEALVDLMASESVTVNSFVTPFWYLAAPHLEGRELPSLRWNGAGGAAVPPDLSERVRRATGHAIHQGWGMTETGPMATLVSLKSELAEAADAELIDVRASAGLPYPGMLLRLVDESGAEVEWDGETPGELQVRGVWAASGYFEVEAPEAFTDDGWLRTGDVATIDASGYLRIVDRIKDVVKSGGLWVGTIELENLLMAHPTVAEAAVFGVPHEEWGERPVAVLVPAPDARIDPDELRTALKPHVPRFWIPDDFVAVAEIARSSTGKWDKKLLRDEYRDHLTGGRRPLA